MDGEELKTEEEPVAQKVALTENKTEPKDKGGLQLKKGKEDRIWISSAFWTTTTINYWTIIIPTHWHASIASKVLFYWVDSATEGKRWWLSVENQNYSLKAFNQHNYRFKKE